MIKVYDWNKVGSAKLIASGEIPLANLSPFTKSTQKIPLKNEINSTETDSFVTLSIIFHPEILNKKKQKTGTITNATKTFNDLGNAIGGGVSTGVNDVGDIVGGIGSKIGGLLKKKDKDENKKSKEEEKVIPKEESKEKQVIQKENKDEQVSQDKSKVEQVIPEEEHKVEEIIPKNEETISKKEEPKTEVVREPEETKPVNGINGDHAKQEEIKDEHRLEAKDEPKQAGEVNGIRPYNVEFKKDNSNQEEIPKQEQEEKNNFKEGSKTSRHIEFENNPLSRSVELNNVKRDQDEGPGSSEENGKLNNLIRYILFILIF